MSKKKKAEQEAAVEEVAEAAEEVAEATPEEVAEAAEEVAEAAPEENSGESTMHVAEEDIFTIESHKAYSLVLARIDGFPEYFPNDTMVIYEHEDPGHHIALRFESAEAMDVVITQLQTMRDEFVNKVTRLQEFVKAAEEEAQAEETAESVADDDGDMDRESESTAKAGESTVEAEE